MKKASTPAADLTAVASSCNEDLTPELPSGGGCVQLLHTIETKDVLFNYLCDAAKIMMLVLMIAFT